MVDTLSSGGSASNSVKVQLLSSAQKILNLLFFIKPFFVLEFVPMETEFTYSVRKPENTEYELVTGNFAQFTEPGTTYALETALPDPTTRAHPQDPVEQVINFLGLGLASRHAKAKPSHVIYDPSITNAWIKEQAETQRFFGVTTPETLTIVPTPAGAIKNKNVRVSMYNSLRRPLTPEEALSFMIFTRLDSTGRPNYGYLITSVMMYITEATEGWVSERLSFRHVRRRDVLGIEDLMAQSRHNWEALMKFAVRFPMQGGRGSSG